MLRDGRLPERFHVYKDSKKVGFQFYLLETEREWGRRKDGKQFTCCSSLNKSCSNISCRADLLYPVTAFLNKFSQTSLICSIESLSLSHTNSQNEGGLDTALHRAALAL